MAQEPIEVTLRCGSDAQFPLAGNFSAIQGLDVLLQDIQTLLLTIPGERVTRPDYGCYLRTQLWENIDTAYTAGIASIKSALFQFEPRITVIDVTGSMNRNTELITYKISFIVKNTDQAINLIFPVRSGTSLSFS